MNSPPRDAHETLRLLVQGRRTVKSFRPEPVEATVVRELVDTARWAPNHRLTNPWRFRVLGARSLQALKDAAGEGAAKLDRAPTLVAVSATTGKGPIQDEEDLLATGCAAYIVLLSAHARGLAGYWRTPGVMRTAAGRRACSIPDDEHVVGLLHLGIADEQPDPPQGRRDVDDVLQFLP